MLIRIHSTDDNGCPLQRTLKVEAAKAGLGVRGMGGTQCKKIQKLVVNNKKYRMHIDRFKLS
jgi:hypothetical protein